MKVKIYRRKDKVYGKIVLNIDELILLFPQFNYKEIIDEVEVGVTVKFKGEEIAKEEVKEKDKIVRDILSMLTEVVKS